jgi:hypothetical protein
LEISVPAGGGDLNLDAVRRELEERRNRASGWPRSPSVLSVAARWDSASEPAMARLRR